MNTKREEPAEAVFRVPISDPHAVVGATLRPPRALTAGRRRSDRWLVWAIVAAIAAFCLFALFVAWEVAQLRDVMETARLCRTS